MGVARGFGVGVVVSVTVGWSTSGTTVPLLTNEQALNNIRDNREITPVKCCMVFKKNLMAND
jgi:hypothetical protein